PSCTEIICRRRRKETLIKIWLPKTEITALTIEYRNSEGAPLIVGDDVRRLKHAKRTEHRTPCVGACATLFHRNRFRRAGFDQADQPSPGRRVCDAVEPCQDHPVRSARDGH